MLDPKKNEDAQEQDERTLGEAQVEVDELRKIAEKISREFENLDKEGAS